MLPALFALDEDLKPVPELAAAWPAPADYSFDPFTVTLDLRSAVWSDGEPIDAADVRFSAKQLRGGPTGYRYEVLRDVEVVSARRLKLHFDRPMRRWWSLFSVDDMVLPEHEYSKKTWDRGPTVSGGPFVVEEWTDGLRIRLKRNERYWQGVVPLARIDVVFVPDDETRFQLLGTGGGAGGGDTERLDAFFSEGGSNLGRRAKARSIETVDGALDGQAVASGAFGPTWWELDLDPARLRPAVAHAVIEAVHPTLVTEILEDSARSMNGIPPDFTTVRESAEPWSGRGSLGQAAALLDAGGIPKGSERARFQLAFPRFEGAGGIATFIHFRLKEIGITAELVGIEPDSFERTWVSERRAPAMIRLRRGADAPDAASYAASDETAARQPGSAPIDDLLTAAISQVNKDRAQKEPILGVAATPWADAQRGLVRAATAAPLVRARSFIVGSPGLSGPHALGGSNGPLWNAGTWTLDQ